MSNPWGLTPRQLEAARLASFYTFEEMGKRMGVSPRTAKALTDRARRRMDVKSKREVGRLLAEQGLLIETEGGSE